jgi:hypothetical protein
MGILAYFFEKSSKIKFVKLVNKKSLKYSQIKTNFSNFQI